MHYLLEKIFEKRGIKDVSQLTPDERVDVERWQATLTGDITVDKIREFCDNQGKLIDSRLQDVSTPTETIVRLVLQRNVYQALLGLISQPSAERESLEKYLTTLLQ